jgi:hypothetical protein
VTTIPTDAWITTEILALIAGLCFGIAIGLSWRKK